VEDYEEHNKFRREEEKKKISNASELYLESRMRMLEAESEYSLYRLLVECIEIGASMLKDNTLREKVAKTLSADGNYLEKYNISYQDRKVYQLSTGSERIGKITCRPEDLEFSKEAIREQLSSLIIAKLKPLNNEIFNQLIKEGIIRVVSVDEEFEQKLLEEFNE
jgi:hypothetical protein